MAQTVSHVLVGVDFSNYSKTVVKQARLLANKFNKPLVLVHVFDDPIANDWQFSMVKAELYETFRKNVQKFYKTTNESIEIRRGKASKQILSVAKKFSNPLIFAGHTGESGVLERFFLGSTAERLALRSPYLTLIYRGGDLGNISRVLVPCDLSERSARSLKGLKSLGLKNLKLELLHVSTPPPPIFDYDDWSMIYGGFKEAQEGRIESFRKKFAPIKLTAVMANNIPDAIRKQAPKYDLIAISPSEKRDFISDFGSVTSKVVRSGRTSILIVP